MIKQLIRSAKIDKEIMLKVGLRIIDSHEIEEVGALLDSGVTGLFINCAWLCQKKITTCKLEHPIEVYNIDRSINRGGSITKEVTLILSYQGHCKGNSQIPILQLCNSATHATLCNSCNSVQLST